MSSSTEGDKLYTLDEARMELKREECALNGHDYETVQEIGRADPTMIVCRRCGKRWEVYLA